MSSSSPAQPKPSCPFCDRAPTDTWKTITLYDRAPTDKWPISIVSKIPFGHVGEVKVDLLHVVALGEVPIGHMGEVKAAN